MKREARWSKPPDGPRGAPPLRRPGGTARGSGAGGPPPASRPAERVPVPAPEEPVPAGAGQAGAAAGPGGAGDWQVRILLLERRVVTLRRSRRVLLELLATQQARYEAEVSQLRRRVDELERQRQRLLAFIRRRRVLPGKAAASGGPQR
ncbi:hypothetical protein DYI95_005325 [Thermaerobacter sp. PB12/4term]|uniref:hypothetical protein n=1 Tax=Thermaerobacter sp. PB12/4term TaxID=2293838 RepID=UPI000E326468|nr:hypothetical protein [Thermaerobacter sp. PB12/4term]QIA26130.1 hypothetical protein DYI95_005325 [Thermaerobacter sp. PB12/4term]